MIKVEFNIKFTFDIEYKVKVNIFDKAILKSMNSKQTRIMQIKLRKTQLNQLCMEWRLSIKPLMKMFQSLHLR